MASTSPPAEYPLECDPGADFVFEFYIPGNYSTATGEMHVRRVPTQALITSGAVSFGAHIAASDETLVTLTITDTVTAALEDGTKARYDVLVILGSLAEFWLAGDFIINKRITQPGVS